MADESQQQSNYVNDLSEEDATDLADSFEMLKKMKERKGKKMSAFLENQQGNLVQNNTTSNRSESSSFKMGKEDAKDLTEGLEMLKAIKEKKGQKLSSFLEDQRETAFPESTRLRSSAELAMEKADKMIAEEKKEATGKEFTPPDGRIILPDGKISSISIKKPPSGHFFNEAIKKARFDKEWTKRQEEIEENVKRKMAENDLKIKNFVASPLMESPSIKTEIPNIPISPQRQNIPPKPASMLEGKMKNSQNSDDLMSSLDGAELITNKDGQQYKALNQKFFIDKLFKTGDKRFLNYLTRTDGIRENAERVFDQNRQKEAVGQEETNLSENDYRKQLAKDRNGAGRGLSAPVSHINKLPSNNAKSAKESEASNVVNMNDYRNSLKADQNKSVASRGNENKGGDKSKKTKQKELQKTIDNYKKAHFKIILVIALISDIGDGWWLTGLIFKPIILYFFHKQGEEGKAKVKDFMRKMKMLTWFDFIPVVDVLPLTTIAVLMTWHIKKKECDMAKKKLESGDGKQENNEEDEGDQDESEEDEQEDNELAKAA